MKIIIAIGASASGKTTYLKKHFVPEGGKNKAEGLVKYYQFDNNIAIGHYYIDKRCEGCDTLSYAVMPKLVNFLQESYCKNKHNTIIMDGDRIASKKFFQFLQILDVPVEIFYFSCSLATSLQRRGDNSIKFVKTTATKSKNLLLFSQLMKFKVNLIKT